MEELDIKELLGVFWSRKIRICLIILVFGVFGFCYSKFLMTPLYQSYTNILLVQTEEESASGTSDATQQVANLNLSQKLMANYSELIRSKTVIREVKDNLRLKKSEEALRNNIAVSAVGSSNFIKITVTSEDPEEAALIAKEITEVFAEKVKEIYKINNVNIIDEPEVETTPSNINHKKQMVIFAAIGFLVAAGYVFISFLLDTTIKSQEDIEKHTEMLVLASIPEYHEEEKGGKRKK